MTAHARGSLGEAHDREDGKQAAGRILAVLHVRNLRIPVEAVAGMVLASASSVHSWLAWHDESEAGALRDLPRPGRPRLAGRARMGRIIGGISRLHARVALVRERIREVTGTLCRRSIVRLRMRKHGLSHKRAHPAHASRTSDQEVRKWQRDEGERIRELQRRGSALVAQNEAFVLHGAGGEPGPWPGRGELAPVPHAGSHRKVVLYGAIADDGRRLCQVARKFDATTFVVYLRKLHKKFGRVVVVPGRAPRHSAAAPKEYPRSCGGEAGLVYLQVGTPEPDASEGLWHQLRRILAEMYLHDFGEFRRAVGGILRTMPHTLDVSAYLRRSVKRDIAPR